MEEKVYLTSDQYVVKLLGDKEKEIAKLNEKYDELLKRFVVLQAKNDKLQKIQKCFHIEKTLGGKGYQIVFRKTDNTYVGLYAMCFDGKSPDQEFLDALDLFGLQLPKEQ